MGKLAKFFIICGAVCVLGIGLFVAGIATGGIDDINKVAHKYEWVTGSPGVIETELTDGNEFSSINIDGTADVMIVGPKNWVDGKNMAEDSDEALVNTVKAGDVVVQYGEEIPKPTVEVVDGTLNINAPEPEYGGKIEMNFTDEDGIPNIIVFCPDKKLNSIRSNNPFGDIEIYGVDFASADIVTNNGDADLVDVTSDKLNIQSEGGDADLNGTFLGKTTVATSDGDVDFMTSIDRSKYTIDAYSNGGDVKDGENDNIGPTYKRDGGDNIIKLRTYNGDIDLWFGDTLF